MPNTSSIGTPPGSKTSAISSWAPGAGSAAYCIIEQGRVDQILQANAAARRSIFEEAAGISRFKSRKAEALRKLERVDQNLLRLTDIVDEVESRLNSLRTQAGKAAKFREISAELKKLWWGLAGDDYRFRSQALEELDAEIAECAARLESVNAEHGQLEEQLGGLDAEIAEVEDELRTVERASSARRETLASHESTTRFQTARLKELDGELARLRKQRTQIERPRDGSRPGNGARPRPGAAFCQGV